MPAHNWRATSLGRSHQHGIVAGSPFMETRGDWKMRRNKSQRKLSAQNSTWIVAASALMCVSTSAWAEILNFTMRLDGSQEVPAVTTPATGAGTATLDTTTNLFSWNINFSGLSAAQTAAHFHGTGLQCVSAGVIITL